MTIEWQDNFSVGDDTLDQQHMRLFDIMNQFYDKIVSHPEKELVILPDVLDKLFDFVQYHFETEENYMRKIGYSDVEDHLIAHNEILDELMHLKERLFKKEIEISVEMIVFFEEWIINHILGVDAKYKIEK